MYFIFLRVHLPNFVSQERRWSPRINHFGKYRFLCRKVCVSPAQSTHDLCVSVPVCFLVFCTLGVVWLGWGELHKAQLQLQMCSESNILALRC